VSPLFIGTKVTIQHKDIDEADLHESKGVSTALNGQFFAANGAGSGSFQNSLMNCHGQMNINSNTVTKALTAAADATLNTNTDYSKLTGASAPWVSLLNHNTTFTLDHITVPFAGYYLLSFWSSVKIANTNNFIGIKFAVNSTLSTQKIISQASTANDSRNLSATSIIGPLSAND